MAQSAEKRQHPRLPIDLNVEVEITTPGGTVHGTIRDISLSGMFVNSAELFPVDVVCGVEIIMKTGAQEMRIKGHTQVARQVEDPETGDRGMGFRFIDIDKAQEENNET